ncbi:MAG: hypothetical protein OCD02_14305 [Spirochaetaceae bacterium]
MKYKKRMKPQWNNIHLVQEALGKKLKKHDKGYIDSVKMVSGELLENSVKYYMKKKIKRPIEYRFSNNNGIEISICNQEIEHDDMQTVVTLFEKIKKSKKPYDLFLDRLQEILDNRIKGESKLGLLRIASEGGYNLDYKYKDKSFTICANKSAIAKEITMKSLEYEDLKIEVTTLDTYVKVAWIGKCRTLNPENILDTYLAKLTQFSKGHKIVVTFDLLESMNSSTVPPLLTFIKDLEENGIDSTFLFDDNEDWQRASFKPLSIIAGRYKNIKIRPFSVQETE